MEAFSSVQTRYNYLIGEDETSADTIGKSHINWSIKDIINRHPFTWNRATSDVTLTSGTGDISTTYNPKWGIEDARIVGSGENDDDIFTQIPIRERDLFSSTDYRFWITWDATNEVFVFNSPTQTGTVVTYHQFNPTDLSADADVCNVPDGEAVAMLAAAKAWVGNERNQELRQNYLEDAEKKIQSMIQSDLEFQEIQYQSSLVNLNFGKVDPFPIVKP